jgi:hypothetical protein
MSLLLLIVTPTVKALGRVPVDGFHSFTPWYGVKAMPFAESNAFVAFRNA